MTDRKIKDDRHNSMTQTPLNVSEARAILAMEQLTHLLRTQLPEAVDREAWNNLVRSARERVESYEKHGLLYAKARGT